jgi:hypothetical protein
MKQVIVVEGRTGEELSRLVNDILKDLEGDGELLIDIKFSRIPDHDHTYSALILYEAKKSLV